MLKLDIGELVGRLDRHIAAADGYLEILVAVDAVDKHHQRAVAELHALSLDGEKRLDERSKIKNIYHLGVCKRAGGADLCHVFAILRVIGRQSEAHRVAAGGLHGADDEVEQVGAGCSHYLGNAAVP